MESQSLHCTYIHVHMNNSCRSSLWSSSSLYYSLRCLCRAAIVLLVIFCKSSNIVSPISLDFFELICLPLSSLLLFGRLSDNVTSLVFSLVRSFDSSLFAVEIMGAETGLSAITVGGDESVIGYALHIDKNWAQFVVIVNILELLLICLRWLIDDPTGVVLFDELLLFDVDVIFEAGTSSNLN